MTLTLWNGMHCSFIHPDFKLWMCGAYWCMQNMRAFIHLLLLNLPLIFMEVSEHFMLKKSFPAAVDVTQTYPGEKAYKRQYIQVLAHNVPS